MSGLLHASSTQTIPGWLLWENTTTTAIASAKTTAGFTTAVASATAIVDGTLLLQRGIDVAWGLLANSHVELLDVRQLALHCGQTGGLAFDCFLRGSVRGAKFARDLLYNASNALLSTAAILRKYAHGHTGTGSAKSISRVTSQKHLTAVR